jgi:predicted Zn-dependent protease with MMP-like domain
VLASILLLAACPEETKDQLYFDDLNPPIGVGEVTIIKDESLNKPTGGEVTVVATVEPDVDKDELQRLMESFHRQISRRSGFTKGNRPERIEMRFYTSKAAAEKGGDDWLARGIQTSSESEPEYTNRQKPPLRKWAIEALGTGMRVFGDETKPQFLADPDAMTLQITWPFVEHDGSGTYVEELSHEKATTEFSSTAITMFEKIPQLQKLTFVGKHEDEVVMKVVLTREQFDELNIKQVEEQLGAYQGQFIELLVSQKISSEKVAKKVRKQRRKVYKEVFARLPEDQVLLSKELK